MTKKVNKNKKLVSGILVILLLTCYLFATGAVAQQTGLESINAKINYTPDHLSYGDVWGFNESVYNQSKYSLAGASKIEWYTKGGI